MLKIHLIYSISYENKSLVFIFASFFFFFTEWKVVNTGEHAEKKFLRANICTIVVNTLAQFKELTIKFSMYGQTVQMHAYNFTVATCLISSDEIYHWNCYLFDFSVDFVKLTELADHRDINEFVQSSLCVSYRRVRLNVWYISIYVILYLSIYMRSVIIYTWSVSTFP